MIECPSSPESSYAPELYIGLWLTRDVRESSSVASSRHREHTQGIKGLRVPPDVLTFSLLFSAFFRSNDQYVAVAAAMVAAAAASCIPKVSGALYRRQTPSIPYLGCVGANPIHE